MEQTFLDLFLQIFNSVGITAKIILFFIAAFIFLYIQKKDFREGVSEMLSRIFNIIRNKQSLSHDFFYRKPFYMRQINRIEFEDVDKTELFRILLTLKVNAAIDITQKFIADNEQKLKKLDIYELAGMLIGNTEKIIETYEADTLAAYLKLHGEEKSKNLYKLIYDAFYDFHQPRVDMINEYISNVHHYDKEYDEIMHDYLSLLHIALSLAIGDTFRAFQKLNGQIAAIIHN